VLSDTSRSLADSTRYALSMSALSSYPMSKGTGTCCATREPIAQGATFIAALVDVPLAGLQRQDFSVAAWEAGARPAAPAQLFGFWRSIYQPHAKPKQQLLDDDTLLEVFESTSQTTDPRQVRFRYLLTLLLTRRRLLRVVATKSRDGMKILHVLRRGEPHLTPMEVVDPGLDDLSIADAMESLAPLLDPDAAAQPTPSADSSQSTGEAVS